MDIGLTLPSFVPGADRADILEWCRRIDDGPFTSISVGERIAYPSHEIVATLAFAAAATERVRIVSTVAVLPIHDPVRLAKQMATIDVLSGGRLTVGVGVGGRDQDYAALGVPFERRFARVDEQVAIMQRVWAGEIVVEGLPPIGPTPVQPGGPPLLTAAMGPRRSRAARSGRTGSPASTSARIPAVSTRCSGGPRRPGPTRAGRNRRCSRRARGSRSATARTTGSSRTRSTTSRTSATSAAKAMAALCRLSDAGALRETLAELRRPGATKWCSSRRRPTSPSSIACSPLSASG